MKSAGHITLLNRYLTLSWITFALIGVIILGLLFFLFGIDWSGPPKILLPNSAILEPVLKSPEGEAFAKRYPNYTSSVMQDFYMARCCQVTLQSGNGPSVMLIAHVSVSKDLKTRTVDKDILLWCIPHSDGYTVKGNIVQNLQPEKQNCWETPPSVPSNQELIDIAKNTTVGKKYLAIYPENDIAVNYEGVISVGWNVIFTPRVNEPISFVVKVAGLDREIVDIHIRCADGAYRYPTDPNFWSYFEPTNNCLHPVH